MSKKREIRNLIADLWLLYWAYQNLEHEIIFGLERVSTFGLDIRPDKCLAIEDRVYELANRVHRVRQSRLWHDADFSDDVDDNSAVRAPSLLHEQRTDET